MKILINVERFFRQKIFPSENLPIINGLLRHVNRHEFCICERKMLSAEKNRM